MEYILKTKTLKKIDALIDDISIGAYNEKSLVQQLIQIKILAIAENEGGANPNDTRISHNFEEAQTELDILEKQGYLKYIGDATYIFKK